jgi:pyridoxamine 5'-phosphate oxidase
MSSFNLKALQKADDAPDNPFILFKDWLEEAAEHERPNHTAMGVATTSSDGVPSLRTVLMREYDESGFIFYTNSLSQKGEEISACPSACLNFWWKNLERQIRITGPIAPVSNKRSDEYFAGRPRGSQIGAWASKQSKELDSRRTLEERIKKYEEKFKDLDTIPRPPHWHGYIVAPIKIEFWQEGEFRIHTRLLYELSDKNWSKKLLYP